MTMHTKIYQNTMPDDARLFDPDDDQAYVDPPWAWTDNHMFTIAGMMFTMGSVVTAFIAWLW